MISSSMAAYTGRSTTLPSLAPRISCLPSGKPCVGTGVVSPASCVPNQRPCVGATAVTSAHRTRPATGWSAATGRSLFDFVVSAVVPKTIAWPEVADEPCQDKSCGTSSGPFASRCMDVHVIPLLWNEWLDLLLGSYLNTKVSECSGIFTGGGHMAISPLAYFFVKCNLLRQYVLAW